MGTSRSWKKLKKEQFKLTSEVIVDDDHKLIFSSINPIERNKRIKSIIKSVAEAPIKERKATKEEKDEMEKENPSVSKAMLREMKIRYRDLEDEEYRNKIEAEQSWINIAVEFINVDLSQKSGTKALWEDLELEDEYDYIGFVKFLYEYLGLTGNDFLTKVKLAQRIVEGESSVKALLDLENNLTGHAKTRAFNAMFTALQNVIQGDELDEGAE